MRFSQLIGKIAVLFVTLLAGAGPVYGQQAGNNDAAPVLLQAKMTEESDIIAEGLVWRIYSAPAGDSGETLTEFASTAGGAKTFKMSPGKYTVLVIHGYASAIRTIEVSKDGGNLEIFILDAGGLQLSAVTAPDITVRSELLRFDIFADETDNSGIRPLVVGNLRPNKMVLLNAGTYHIVSKYGKLNAVVRADIRVRPGNVTSATLQHHAARVTLKLVREAGADAIADTAWSILTASGDVIRESVGAFPRLVLAEGNYTAVAKNNEKIYSKDFLVESGIDSDVEVVVVR